MGLEKRRIFVVTRTDGLSISQSMYVLESPRTLQSNVKESNHFLGHFKPIQCGKGDTVMISVRSFPRNLISAFPFPILIDEPPLISVFKMSVHLTKIKDYKNLLDNYETWLFDCDGVLWHDDEVIDGVIEVLGILRRQGEHCRGYSSTDFVSTKRRQKDNLRH